MVLTGQQTRYNEIPYATDGLVACIDGIETGGFGNQRTPNFVLDCVTGRKSYPIEFGKDFVIYKPNTVISEFVPDMTRSYTVEICFGQDEFLGFDEGFFNSIIYIGQNSSTAYNFTLFCNHNQSSKIRTARCNSDINWMTKSADPVHLTVSSVMPFGVKTQAIDPTYKTYINGEFISERNAWYANQNYFIKSGQIWSGHGWFGVAANSLGDADVKIHSIRVYDRQLSESEIIANYNIDKERFGV